MPPTNDDPQIDFAHVQQFIQAGSLDAAWELCLQLHDRYPQNTWVLNVLGSLQIRRGQLEQAVDFLQKSLNIDAEQVITLAELGNALNGLKRYADALPIYEKALQLKPNYLEVYANYSISLIKCKQLGQALLCLNQAISLQTNYAPFYAHRAYVLTQLNYFEEALLDCRHAIAINPDYVEAYINGGIALNHLHRCTEALHYYAKAINLKPDCAEVYCNMGISLNKLKRYADALICYQQAIQLNPDNAEVYSNRGVSLTALDCFEDALLSFELALALKPDYMEAYSNRGIALHKLRRYPEALASYAQAIELQTDSAEAYVNRGNTLSACKQYAEALKNYEQAIALNPEFAEAYSNRGVTMNECERYVESLENFAQAIAIKPDYAEAFYNRAMTLTVLNDYQGGLKNYQQAIALKPNYAEAYWNMALLKLQLGDFKAGWQLYEWRWKTADFPSPNRPFQQTLWLGETTLEGKTLLLHAEQGLGDSIQFCRYALKFTEQNVRVILEVPKPLLHLMRSLSAEISCIERGTVLPDFDTHCPLLSLPLAFSTQLETIPAKVPYLFADPYKHKFWQEKLPKNSLKRIGLVFSGSAWHSNDQHRSIALSLFLPLLQLPFNWYCLQNEFRNADHEFLANCPQLTSYASLLTDLSDTAALLAELDLVISVDTAVAHLAGAMGKPVWILLPHNADYRWLLERNDSPWYPSAQLFRQQELGNWSPVIEEIRTCLLLSQHD